MVVAGVSLESGMSHFVLSGLDGKPVDGTAQTFIAGDSYEGILESIRSLLDSCSSNISGVCGGLCITLPGLLNEDDGVVLFSTNYPMLNGRKIGSDLAQMLKVPVICRQENHALVIGERRLGENPNLTNFAVCDVGVGIGLGIFEQERFIVGESNFTGEIGHVSLDPIHGAICSCGRRGCFETLCSERALINNLKIALGREINVDEIGYLFKNQTASTSVIFEAFTSNLALLMSIIVNTLNPAAIMITGSICDHAPELVPLVAEKCKQFALEHILDNCTITTGSVSKVSGATACMIDELFSQVGPLLS
jgi:predicted NBD/HSP70 family sugar kinase